MPQSIISGALWAGAHDQLLMPRAEESWLHGQSFSVPPSQTLAFLSPSHSKWMMWPFWAGVEPRPPVKVGDPLVKHPNRASSDVAIGGKHYAQTSAKGKVGCLVTVVSMCPDVCRRAYTLHAQLLVNALHIHTQYTSLPPLSLSLPLSNGEILSQPVGFPGKIILLVECRTLWGESERVHMQNMEQLYAYDRYQNVAEHRNSGHKIWSKIYRHMHNTETGSGS